MEVQGPITTKNVMLSLVLFEYWENISDTLPDIMSRRGIGSIKSTEYSLNDM